MRSPSAKVACGLDCLLFDQFQTINLDGLISFFEHVSLADIEVVLRHNEPSLRLGEWVQSS
jgi:hypothetical protein